MSNRLCLKVIIPRKTIGEARKLLDDTSAENIAISLSENKIRFIMEDVTLTSKLIDGTYPDYERVIPTDNDKVLELGVKDLSQAVDRVSVVAERTRAIKVITAPNHITITTSSPDLGSAQEEVEAKYDSDSLEMKLKVTASKSVLPTALLLPLFMTLLIPAPFTFLCR